MTKLELKESLKKQGINQVYLSGPITSVGYFEAKKRFTAVQKNLEELDICSISTFSRPHPLQRKKEYYVRHGIRELLDCGAVIVVGDNKLSKNSQLEVTLAKGLEMPIFRLNLETNKIIQDK